MEQRKLNDQANTLVDFAKVCMNDLIHDESWYMSHSFWFFVDFTTKNMLFELFNIGRNVEARFLFLNNLLYKMTKKGQKWKSSWAYMIKIGLKYVMLFSTL